MPSITEFRRRRRCRLRRVPGATAGRSLIPEAWACMRVVTLRWSFLWRLCQDRSTSLLLDPPNLLRSRRGPDLSPWRIYASAPAVALMFSDVDSCWGGYSCVHDCGGCPPCRTQPQRLPHFVRAKLWSRNLLLGSSAARWGPPTHWASPSGGPLAVQRLPGEAFRGIPLSIPAPSGLVPFGRARHGRQGLGDGHFFDA